MTGVEGASMAGVEGTGYWLLKRGNGVEGTSYSNAHLSIYGMGDTPAFVIKGDARAFMMGDRMGHVRAFVIRGDTQ
jgi:hypothetical protein